MNNKLENLDAQRVSDFRSQIQHTINCFSKENGSNTPDFILADYLADCLASFDKAVTRRTKWYEPPQAVCEPPQGAEIQVTPNNGVATDGL